MRIGGVGACVLCGCRLYLGTATVVDVLRCWLMIALAAAAAAAALCSSSLPALPCMLHFLLPQDAATKTASKLLKLQQIWAATLSTFSSRGTVTIYVLCMCVCVCAFCCILQGAANRANKLRTAVDLISSGATENRMLVAYSICCLFLHVFLLRKCCYIIYNHDSA